MEVLILGICHEIFFFGKKRSKIRVRIIHRRALYTGKYGNSKKAFEYVIVLSFVCDLLVQPSRLLKIDAESASKSAEIPSIYLGLTFIFLKSSNLYTRSDR